MHLFRNVLFVLALICLAPSTGWTRCEGAVMLSTLHDAYEATLNGKPTHKRSAAQTLLVVAGDRTEDRLVTQLARAGVTVDPPRLADALADARAIATATLAGTSLEPADFRHGLNLTWLAEVVIATRCANSPAHASLTPAQSGNAGATLTGTGVHAEDTPLQVGPTAKLLLIGLALAAIPAALLLRRSVFIRKRQVERLPRFPIALPLDLTFTTPDGEIEEAQGEALDISQGGMKLRWDAPPPTGTLATIPLLGIQRLSRVIWSNPHYAGVMFENALTKPELKSLKESHSPG